MTLGPAKGRSCKPLGAGGVHSCGVSAALCWCCAVHPSVDRPPPPLPLLSRFTPAPGDGIGPRRMAPEPRPCPRTWVYGNPKRISPGCLKVAAWPLYTSSWAPASSLRLDRPPPRGKPLATFPIPSTLDSTPLPVLESLPRRRGGGRESQRVGGPTPLLLRWASFWRAPCHCCQY